MALFAIIAKGIVMIALAAAAFIALAIAIGYEPAAAKTAAQCEAKPAPACLFMILQPGRIIGATAGLALPPSLPHSPAPTTIHVNIRAGRRLQRGRE